MAEPSVITKKTESGEVQECRPDTELFIAVLDAICNPIPNLKVTINTANNAPLVLYTDENGALPVVNFGDEFVKGEAKALLPTGEEETILNLLLSRGTQDSFTCISPYLLLKGKTRIHEGPASVEGKRKAEKPGTAEEKRSKNGNPVNQCTVMDCPNGDNLKLCPNQQYKEIILAASKRTGIMPQAIVALISAEADTIKTQVETPRIDKKGKPVIDKKTGKQKIDSKTINTGEWRVDSANKKSTARGLTQFLGDSWIGEAMEKTTYLHEEVIKRGHIKKVTEQILVKKGSKGKAPIYKERTSLKVMDEDALLAMRMEPEFSIMAAVDYGVRNLKGLDAHSAIDLSGLTDPEKSKFLYLTHHLGLADARDFILNEILEDQMRFITVKGKKVEVPRAYRLLEPQKGEEITEELAEDEKDNAIGKKSYVWAHRRWLIEYIDKKIEALKYFCDPNIPKTPSVFNLILKVGGRHPDKFDIDKS